MSGFLRQATASQSRALGPFLDTSDVPATGLTIANTDIKLVVNGGASANKNSGGGTHRVNGVYGVTFDATDTATVGEMQVSAVVSGALPVFDKFTVVEETVYDALYAASAPGYLQPTTAGRTLDVTATGAAGIDWANVENPTTALNLSATNIDTDQVVASVTGAVGSVTGSVGSVTGAVGSVTGAVGSVTGNVGGNVTGSVGSVATGGITAASIATGAIDRDAFAADTGLQSIRSNTAQAGAATTITLDASASAVDDFYNGMSIQTTGGTGSGQFRIILDYVGSTKVATVETWSTNPDSSTTFAIFPAAETALDIADAVWDELLAGHSITGSAGKALSDGAAGGGPTAASIADAVWDEVLSGHLTAGSTGEALDGAGGGGASAAAIADAVWDELTSGHTTSGTFGEQLKTDVDAILVDTAEIGAAGAGLTAINLPNQTMDIIGNITGNLSGSVGSVTGAVGSVTGAVGSVTGNVGGNVTGSVGSVATGGITAASIATGAIDRDAFAADTGLQSIRSSTAQAGAATTITLDASASAVNDFYNGMSIQTTGGTGSGQFRIILDYVGATKVATVETWSTNPDSTTTFAIFPAAETADDIADAVWDEQLSGHSTVGSAGKALSDGAAGGGPTASSIADAVWDEVLSGHLTAGTTGEALDGAGGGGSSAAAIADAVWDELRAGHVVSGSFGEGVLVAASGITRLSFAPDTGLQSIRSNTAQAGAAGTITLDTGASAVNDFYNSTVIYLTGGTGIGQSRNITDYVGSTKVATIDVVWGTNPDSSTTFAIFPAADTAAEIADQVWDELRAAHVVSGSFGEGVASVQGNVSGSVGSVAVGGITAVSIATGAIDADALATDAVNEIVDAVWDEALSGHVIAGSTGEALADAGGAGSSAADIADAVWDEARAGHTTAGTFGQGVASVQGNVTGSVASVTGSVGSVTGSVGSVTGAVGSVTGSVGSIASGGITTASFAAGAINAAAIATNAIDADAIATDAVTEIQSGLATAAALTVVDDFLDTEITDIRNRLPAALVSGRMDSSVGAMAAGVITATSIASDAITDAKVASDVTIASVTGSVGSVTGSVGSVTGAVGSVTGNVGGNVTGSVGSVAAGGITAASIATGAIDADALATDAVNEIADAVWDEPISGHLTAGSTGAALDDAGTGGGGPTAAAIADAVWDETTTGHTTAGTFGEQLKTDVDAILVDTIEIGVAGAGLTNINLPNQTMDIIGNITGSLSGSVGSVTGAVGSVTGNVSGNVTGSVGSLGAQAKTDVNTEVLDVLVTDTFAEPSSVPGATASLKDKIGWQAAIARNKITQTGSQQVVRNDADSGTIGTSTISDDTITLTRGEFT